MIELGGFRSAAGGSIPRERLPKFTFYSRKNQYLLDGGVFGLSLVCAYVARFEGWPHGKDALQMFCWLPVLIGLRIALQSLVGAYRVVWRFVSLSDALEIAKSISTVSLILFLLRFFVAGHTPAAEVIRLPVSVIAVEGLLSLTGSLAIRALRRIQHSYQRQAAIVADRPRRRVVLYGAGRAGMLLRKELESNGKYLVVGFIDDDRNKVGTMIAGTRVLGSGESLAELAGRWNVHEVVISMATASRSTLLRILAKCRAAEIPAKIIPSLRQILDDPSSISDFKEPRAEELLGRDLVEVDNLASEAARFYRGRRVLVTGAGGSIGSELVRQIARLAPASIAIFDKDENSVYELEQELISKRLGSLTEAHIADVRNLNRLRPIFAEFRPDIVFHAAAHKHVPLMERQPCEAILNNVVGTRNVLQVADEVGVERLVFISSDKAVNPANVMGATKRIGEILVQKFSQDHALRTACVRFGNVLGSRGSVLPLFQKQIAGGGPVTVTHPDMVRYFMTIPEAVQLILCAGTLAGSGDTFVLDMGAPRKILDLAREMITLSGLDPDKDIVTRITGLRPGEKMHEELVTESESLHKTHFEKLSVVERGAGSTVNSDDITQLVESAAANDTLGVFQILSRIEIGFTSVPPIELQAPKARAAAASQR